MTPRSLADAARALELERGLTGPTTNRYLAALGGALRCAAAEGWLPATPPPPRRRENAPRDRAPTRGELAALARALRASGPLGPRYARLARFLWRTGLRLGEALALGAAPGFEVREVALAGGEVRRVAYLPRTKSGRPREVPLPLACPVPPFGAPRSGFHRAFRWARERAGLGAWCVPHALRHARVTAMLLGGVPVPVVADYVGHRDWRTTRRYFHAGAGELARAADVR